MAIYFVSSADGSDSNNGTTLDLAFATKKYALESGGLSAGDAVAVRRTHSEIPTADISPAYDGTVSSPIKVFSCPRTTHAITSSDWTNGSTSVTVDDNDMSRTQHQARYITAPDGKTYFLTRVSATNTIIIDREYAGSTVTNQAATIQADTTHDAWDNYDDSSDTIKKTDWESDADDLPVVDFNDGNFQFYFNTADYYEIYGFEIKDSTDFNGIYRVFASTNHYLEGMLFKQSVQNDAILYSEDCYLRLCRSTIEGSGSGSNQRGIQISNGHLKDVAIYNCGDHGVQGGNTNIGGSSLKLENVNIGVEQANGDDDIGSLVAPFIVGRDVKLGGTNGLVDFPATVDGTNGYISIENYQKILGDHRTFYTGGYYEKTAVSGETPNKKVSDYIIKITPNINIIPTKPFAYIMFEHDIDEVTTGSKIFKYWVYNDTGGTLNSGDAKGNIYIKAEYVSVYDDTSEYYIEEIFSAETNIADAADADDWDSLSVTLNPATTSKVRLTFYLTYYNATTNLFIDPAPVIT